MELFCNPPGSLQTISSVQGREDAYLLQTSTSNYRDFCVSEHDGNCHDNPLYESIA